MLYEATCCWPRLTEIGIEHLTGRVAPVASEPDREASCASTRRRGDDLVFCLLEGQSDAVVMHRSESGGVPYERIVGSVWLTPDQQIAKGVSP
jgi:hypothetical protein